MIADICSFVAPRKQIRCLGAPNHPNAPSGPGCVGEYSDAWTELEEISKNRAVTNAIRLSLAGSRLVTGSRSPYSHSASGA
jgi:hypothetical protein